MTQKTVLITGTSSGIGYITALYLATKGYKVYASMRNLEKGNNLRNQASKEKLDINICSLDVTNDESIHNCIDEILKQDKKIDVLINNAGFTMMGNFEGSTNEDFQKQFATNFYGVLNCTRAVIPSMKEQKHGLIINVSSVLGMISSKEMGAYCASKFALEGWSEATRYELQPYGIFMTLLEPGLFRTEIFNNALFVKGQEQGVQSVKGDPIIVARKIDKIITTTKPRLRYTVGSDAAWISFLKKTLPQFLFEKLLASKYGVMPSNYILKNES